MKYSSTIKLGQNEEDKKKLSLLVSPKKEQAWKAYYSCSSQNEMARKSEPEVFERNPPSSAVKKSTTARNEFLKSSFSIGFGKAFGRASIPINKSSQGASGLFGQTPVKGNLVS